MADKGNRPDNPEDCCEEDAKACANHIRAFDEIMHRYGMCPDIDNPEPVCLICGAARDSSIANKGLADASIG
jgi:hypothetical protein